MKQIIHLEILLQAILSTKLIVEWEYERWNCAPR